tara:strand:+ start:1398 stop:1646 length:249 start_codon:yes stop_codon:yes gene_type:complete
MYSLEYSKDASKQIKKLNKQISERILKTLERIKIRPQSHVKRLVGVPYFSLRVGDYRVILDIKEGKLIILVLEVGHRRNIYK